MQRGSLKLNLQQDLFTWASRLKGKYLVCLEACCTFQTGLLISSIRVMRIHCLYHTGECRLVCKQFIKRCSAFFVFPFSILVCQKTRLVLQHDVFFLFQRILIFARIFTTHSNANTQTITVCVMTTTTAFPAIAELFGLLKQFVLLQKEQ